MMAGRSKLISWKLRVKANKSPGYTPWGRNDDGTKGRRIKNKGNEVHNQVMSMSKQGQRGAVSIHFKFLAWSC